MPANWRKHMIDRRLDAWNAAGSHRGGFPDSVFTENRYMCLPVLAPGRGSLLASVLPRWVWPAACRICTGSVGPRAGAAKTPEKSWWPAGSIHSNLIKDDSHTRKFVFHICKLCGCRHFLISNLVPEEISERGASGICVRERRTTVSGHDINILRIIYHHTTGNNYLRTS